MRRSGVDGKCLGYFAHLTERVCEEGGGERVTGLVMRKVAEGNGKE